MFRSINACLVMTEGKTGAISHYWRGSFQRRFRHNTKKAKRRDQQTKPSEYALAHFDQYYKPVYQNEWTSMRVALLSQQKYAAMVNNFSVAEKNTSTDLLCDGASDIIQLALRKEPVEFSEIQDDDHERLSEPLQSELTEEPSLGAPGRTVEGGEISSNPALYDFVPARLVLSEEEALIEQEKERSVYSPSQIDYLVLPEKRIAIPHLLKVFAYEKCNVSLFSPAKRLQEDNLIAYYLMDAASVMPVVALDLEPDCSVLDLCAAPGGKTLAMLQTGLPGHITCVDHSHSRLQRMKRILATYVPQSYVKEDNIDLVHGDANSFCKLSDPDFLFDRVLVDVPCFTDRHVLHEDYNNIFRPSRIKDRINIQKIQRAILFNGIKMCKPGGSIVYSTCTLSPPQNDGVIEATLEQIHTKTDLQIVIEDLTQLTGRFTDTFVFRRCRFGQLIVPHLTANFGPMYFCKMKRIQ